ncbi:unnamed protein product [Albugo candida]|uniref:B box-type domain-containing protein n=1 Tax=Albugo candida TaxID=65357 RepID=A0A024GAE1_9STRA|nr:unnamed protein product [Albugo candida]|eukprot:CCI43634.1 unnamed protein product [Albugo candida]
MEGDKTKESQHDASLQRMRMFLKRKENEDRLMQLQSKQQSRTNSERFTAKEQVTRQPRTSCSEKGDISSMETCTQDKLEARKLLFPTIPKTSPEFYRIKYLLQCALEEYDLNEFTAWKLPSPNVDNSVSDLLTLDSWILIDDIDTLSENPLELSTALAQNATPMCVGKLTLPQSTTMDGVYAVLFRIIVGHSYTIDSQSSDMILPDGYHSFHLTSKINSNNPNAVLSSQPLYSHRYILTHPNQIVPKCVVRCQLRARRSAHGASKCVLCEIESATVRCKSCNAVLCVKCDQSVHSANKVVRDHTRVSLPPNSSQPDPGQSLDAIKHFVFSQIEKGFSTVTIPCKEHSDTMMDFFCTICNTSLCVQCKMFGDHSAGENGTHRLVSVTNAYENELLESFRPDTLLDTFQESLHNRKEKLQVQQQHVLENHENVERQIRQQCQNALEALEQATTEKKMVLRSASLEVERQLDCIAWTEAFLNANRQRLNALHFIKLWEQHKKIRLEQRNGPILKESHESIVKSVQADSDLSGEISVIKKVDIDEPQRLDTKTATERTLMERYAIRQLVNDCCYKTIDTHMDMAVPEEKYNFSERGRRLMAEIRHEMLSSTVTELQHHELDHQQAFIQSLSEIQPLDPLFELDNLSEKQTSSQKRAREVWMELIQHEFGVA